MRCCPTAPWPDAYIEGKTLAGNDEITISVRLRTWAGSEYDARITNLAVGYQMFKDYRDSKQ